ncbi:hypothetical protein R3P38DRAFT_3217267 [Favolaschia claudopus]|uniref:Uncharacterized protein n=1 Tax=Favolaschia claudopus TaxID=2862362 RepID=A0AAW0A0Z6_9AGAR
MTEAHSVNNDAAGGSLYNRSDCESSYKFADNDPPLVERLAQNAVKTTSAASVEDWFTTAFADLPSGSRTESAPT